MARERAIGTAGLLGSTFALLLGACTGAVDMNGGTPVDPNDPNGPGGPGQGPDGSDTGPVVFPNIQCETRDAPQVGSTPLRRLTRSQWSAAITDLLGIGSDAWKTFPEDERVGPFPANPTQQVSEHHVRRYMEAAEAVAAISDADLGRALPCNPASGEAACARTFVETFGRKAFRRPLDAETTDGLVAVYGVGRDGGTFLEGIRLVLEAMFQAPDFLYHVERKAPSAEPALVALDPYELAARLSFFLWNTLPDEALLAAAASGEILTPEGLRAQADRLLASPRAKDAMSQFAEYWLDISNLRRSNKDVSVHPNFDDSIRFAMIQETTDFFDYVVRQGDGSLHTLMTADFSFVPPSIFGIYGVAGEASPKAPGAIALPADQRSGVLTHASVLAAHAGAKRTSPVARGVYILHNVLCVKIDPPDIPISPVEEPAPNQTTREAFLQHTRNPACAECHLVIDPIGLGFEHYDAVGAYRSTEDGLAIDATGNLVLSSSVDGPFDGAIELAQRLADSEVLESCIPIQFQRFALGRREDPADGCAIQSSIEGFRSSGGNLRELMLGIVMSDPFRFRPPNGT